MLSSPKLTLKTGRQLGADWVVTGIIVSTETRTQLWTAVIDLDAGSVTDVNTVTFHPGQMNAIAKALATFVEGAGLLAPKRPFLLLGEFQKAHREGLAADFNRHYGAAGYCVIEQIAAKPFLALVGLGSQDGSNAESRQRFKLLPQFWTVNLGTQHDDRVSLKVQRVGGPEEEFLIPEADGPTMAKAAREAIQRAMDNAKTRGNTATSLWQSEMHRNRGLERLKGPPLAMIPSGATDRRTAMEQSMRTRAESTRASFEIALAQNPADIEAKYWVGFANVISADPEERARGQKLLEQVAAGDKPELAERARKTLEQALHYRSQQQR